MSGEIDLTMLRQMCRRARLEAFLHDRSFTNPVLSEHGSLLDDPIHSAIPPIPTLDGGATAQFLAKGKRIDPLHYQVLLAYLQAGGQVWKAYNDLVIPEGSLIHPPFAQKSISISVDHRTFTCNSSHIGNSQIQYARPLKAPLHCVGIIDSIYTIPLEGVLSTFFLVREYRHLSAATGFVSGPSMFAHVHHYAWQLTALSIVHDCAVVLHLHKRDANTAITWTSPELQAVQHQVALRALSSCFNELFACPRMDDYSHHARTSKKPSPPPFNPLSSAASSLSLAILNCFRHAIGLPTSTAAHSQQSSPPSPPSTLTADESDKDTEETWDPEERVDRRDWDKNAILDWMIEEAHEEQVRGLPMSSQGTGLTWGWGLALAGCRACTKAH